MRRQRQFQTSLTIFRHSFENLCSLFGGEVELNSREGIARGALRSNLPIMEDKRKLFAHRFSYWFAFTPSLAVYIIDFINGGPTTLSKESVMSKLNLCQVLFFSGFLFRGWHCGLSVGSSLTKQPVLLRSVVHLTWLWPDSARAVPVATFSNHLFHIRMLLLRQPDMCLYNYHS